MTITEVAGQGRWAGHLDRLIAEAAAGREPTDCHPWPGNVDVWGYGRYGQRRAMNVVLERAGIEVPDGHVPDHTCHNGDPRCPGGRACLHRRCVNLLHLEAVTSAANTTRGAQRRTTCGKCGRPYDTVSHTARDGIVRRCSVCTRRSNARSRRN